MKEEKTIRQKQRPNHNIYGDRNRLFIWASLLISAAVLDICILCAAQGYYVSGYEYTADYIAIMWLAVLLPAAAIAAAVLLSRNAKKEIRPYQREEGFSFLGLHLFSEEEDLHDSGILPRDAEAAQIRRILENALFLQEERKQALCLTGESGCGKTSILTFFKQRYKADYAFYDVSADYTALAENIRREFGENAVREIERRAQEKKIVLIFDGFEQYFRLNARQKEEVRAQLLMLNQKNTALILTLRKEYLPDFLREFQIGDLTQTPAAGAAAGALSGAWAGAAAQTDSDAGALSGAWGNAAVRAGNNAGADFSAEFGTDAGADFRTGALVELSVLIRTEEDEGAYIRRPGRTGFTEWRGEHVRYAKKEHLEQPQGMPALRSAKNKEPAASTLLYCENTVASPAGGGTSVYGSGTAAAAGTKAPAAESLEALFGSDGTAFFARHKDKPLIRQQIYFHMAEWEKKNREASADELQELFRMDDEKLLKRYYDVQLASAGSWFHASRVLYLLSILHADDSQHCALSREEIADALFAGQFSKKDEEKLFRVLDELEKRELICAAAAPEAEKAGIAAKTAAAPEGDHAVRKTKVLRKAGKKQAAFAGGEDTGIRYAISHDFIAETFLVYSRTSMLKNICEALDIYANTCVKEAETPQSADSRRQVSESRKTRPKAYLVLYLAAALLGPLFCLYGNIGQSSGVPQAALFLSEFALLYLYEMHRKVFCFRKYSKNSAGKTGGLGLFFAAEAVLLLLGIWNSYVEPFFLGAALVLFAVSCMLQAGMDNSAGARRTRQYGVRFVLIGAVGILCLLVYLTSFAYLVLYLGLIVSAVLLVGSAFCDLTRESLYAKRMDVQL